MTFVAPSLPLLVVDTITPCRDFWVDVLGFQVVAEADVDGTLDFLLLHGPGPSKEAPPVILEYQRRAGLAGPLAARLPLGAPAVVYLWTMSLEAIHARLAARAPHAILGTRRAPYGADELFLEDPAGHLFVAGERRTT